MDGFLAALVTRDPLYAGFASRNPLRGPSIHAFSCYYSSQHFVEGEESLRILKDKGLLLVSRYSCFRFLIDVLGEAMESTL